METEMVNVFRHLVAAVAATLIPTLALGATPPPSPGGAYLGMTLEAWRALPFPGRDGGHLIRNCAPASATSDKGQVAASICSYEIRYGAYSLEPALPLTAQYSAHDPRYSFDDGRLTQLAYRVPIDAFSRLVALFRDSYGMEAQTINDMVRLEGVSRARVLKTWRTPDGFIRMIAPAPRHPNELLVQYGFGAPPSAPV
jgi:hypothetical protein